MTPTPGSKFVKDGIQFTVQMVRDGQVFGVKYRLPVPSDGEIDAALDAGEDPPNYMGNIRVTIEDFERDTEGLTHV